MRQFDIHINPSSRSRDAIPFVVVLQSHLLAASHVTLVAPVLKEDRRSGFTRTSVYVSFQESEFVVLVGELAPIETRQLQPARGNLSLYEDEFRRAIDRLFTGF